MARPWEGKKYTEEEKTERFGPAEAPNGTTREQFYDRMVTHGWNKPSDDSAVMHMYIKLSGYMGRNNADMGAMQELMDETAQMPDEKLELIRSVIERSADPQQENDEQLRNDESRYSFLTDMQGKGFYESGDLDLLATVSSLPNKNIPPENRSFLNMLLTDHYGNTVKGRLAFLNSIEHYYSNVLEENEKEEYKAHYYGAERQDYCRLFPDGEAAGRCAE